MARRMSRTQAEDAYLDGYADFARHQHGAIDPLAFTVLTLADNATDETESFSPDPEPVDVLAEAYQEGYLAAAESGGFIVVRK